MQFIRDLIRNLVILAVIGIILFLMFPSTMEQIFQVYGQLFGPLAILILIVAALPRRRRPK